jgi:hypothetical protein
MKTKMPPATLAMYLIWVAAIITAVFCYFAERMSPGEALSIQNLPIVMGAVFGAVLAGALRLREIRRSRQPKPAPTRPQLPNEVIPELALQGSMRLQTFVFSRIEHECDLVIDESVLKIASPDLFLKQGAEVERSFRSQRMLRRFSASLPMEVVLR